MYFPAGVYSITPNTITLASNVNLIGSGEGTVVRSTTQSSNTAFFTGSNVNNIKIADMFISGVNTAPLLTAPPSNTWAIQITTGNNITIDHVRLEQFYEDIHVSNVGNSRFNAITDFTGSQIYGGPGSLDMIWSHSLATSTITNMIGYCQDTCIRLDGARNVVVSDSQFVGGSIEINNAEGQGPSQDITIENNQFSQNFTLGIRAPYLFGFTIRRNDRQWIFFRNQ